MDFVVFPRNKVSRPFLATLSNFLLFLFCFVLSYQAKLTSSEDCSYVNDCKCVFRNGSEIDLTSLGYHGEPRWNNVKPTRSQNFTYSYNPCFKFSIGNRACENVQVCQTSIGGEHYNCGNRALFSGNGANGLTYVIYTGDDNRKTNVTLVCSPEDRVPRLNITGEVEKKEYEMTLTTRCACADLCREEHLSAGSVLVIIFMIFVALYLVLGIIHSSLTRGAHGWELIPHHEFWADFPLLVRDGCVFVISGCKPETAYERI